MLTWFVPLVLFVVAAFALGVIVGRLAWASSGSGSLFKPIVSTVTNRSRRGESPSSQSAPPDDSGDHSLPMWHMKEIEAPISSAD